MTLPALPYPPTPADGGAPFSDDGRDDGAVDRLLDLLATLDPAEGALARGCLPRCDSTFGAGLALFLSVTAAGCRGWLTDDAADRLEELDGGLLLDDCDTALAPRLRTLDGRAWRVLRVPLLDPATAAVMPVGLLCATSTGTDGADAFVVVLQARPRATGAVQLTATRAGRRLDVTLRTAGGLPAALLAELHETARAVLDACRLTGSLTVGPLAGEWLRFDEDLSSDLAL
ncbi:hypothetical protein [Azospirillum halopraeferens]|uniref:hypothetical protein n=1 Tax=Azospirillum halopraeferens TaxID=34010 RepID=UPI0003F65372|nr:hypothetical protein [Azospirillum halopraeferens]